MVEHTGKLTWIMMNPDQCTIYIFFFQLKKKKFKSAANCIGIRAHEDMTDSAPVMLTTFPVVFNEFKNSFLGITKDNWKGPATKKPLSAAHLNILSAALNKLVLQAVTAGAWGQLQECHQRYNRGECRALKIHCLPGKHTPGF